MKQLLIASALALAVASIPAVAATNYSVGTTGFSNYSSSSNPDDRYDWRAPCPGEAGEVTVSNLSHDNIEVFIKVDTHSSGPSASVNGGDCAVVECNGYNNIVKPGNFFLCKTKRNVEIEDNGGGYGAKGYFTVEY